MSTIVRLAVAAAFLAGSITIRPAPASAYDELYNGLFGGAVGAGIGYGFGGPRGAAIGGGIGLAVGFLSSHFYTAHSYQSRDDDTAYYVPTVIRRILICRRRRRAPITPFLIRRRRPPSAIPFINSLGASLTTKRPCSRNHQKISTAVIVGSFRQPLLFLAPRFRLTERRAGKPMAFGESFLNYRQS